MGSGSGLIVRFYPSIRLERLRTITKNLSQDNWSPGRDLNPGHPEYEAGVPTSRPRRSVFKVGIRHLPGGTEEH
jgi:hypothetical protein